MKKQKREKIHLHHVVILGWQLDRYGIVPDDPKSLDFEFTTTIKMPDNLQPASKKAIKLVEKPMNLGTGGQVWPRASFALLHALTSQQILSTALTSLIPHRDLTSTLNLDGKRMIELGSGTGFISIASVLLMNLAEIVITDLSELKPHIRRNLVKNGMRKPENDEGKEWKGSVAENVRVKGLDWRNDSSSFGKFDLILCCDCIYEEFCFIPLVSTIETLARGPNEEGDPSVVIIAYEERRIHEDKFWDVFNKGFDCYPVPLPSEGDGIAGVHVVVAIKKSKS